MDSTEGEKVLINPTSVCEPTGHLSSDNPSSPYEGANAETLLFTTNPQRTLLIQAVERFHKKQTVQGTPCVIY